MGLALGDDELEAGAGCRRSTPCANGLETPLTSACKELVRPSAGCAEICKDGVVRRRSEPLVRPRDRGLRPDVEECRAHSPEAVPMGSDEVPTKLGLALPANIDGVPAGPGGQRRGRG